MKKNSSPKKSSNEGKSKSISGPEAIQIALNTVSGEVDDVELETKNKLGYHQKLSLQVYDKIDLNGKAFFEIKQKHKKVVNKRRMLLPFKAIGDDKFRYDDFIYLCYS